MSVRSMVTTNPGVNLTLVTGHEGGNMVFHDVDQSGLVGDGRNPAR